ncbi:MAG: YbhB/YbcL family Raf kinase inhibitor-like protein, partial [Isosphaeraceae bacterium]
APQGINGWETLGYRGPEPARDGKINHYVFTLFALDAPLLLVPGLTRRSLQRAMFGHVLGRAETSGTYPPAGLADPGA